MRATPFITLVFLLMVGSAFAQQPNPYDQIYRLEAKKRADQERDNFLDMIRYVFFAVGCKVVPDYSASAAAQGEAFRMIQRSGGGLNGDFFDTVHHASREGMEKSKKPNACDYWKEHPDEVYNVRNAVMNSIRSSAPLR